MVWSCSSWFETCWLEPNAVIGSKKSTRSHVNYRQNIGRHWYIAHPIINSEFANKLAKQLNTLNISMKRRTNTIVAEFTVGLVTAIHHEQLIALSILKDNSDRSWFHTMPPGCGACLPSGTNMPCPAVSAHWVPADNLNSVGDLPPGIKFSMNALQTTSQCDIFN